LFLTAVNLHHARRLKGRRVLALRPLGFVALGASALLVGSLFWTARFESARKVVAQVGAAGPLLSVLPAAFDWDGDGFAAVLGGGDCDDADPTVNPAALDWPADGEDQDCDGVDAKLERMAEPNFVPLPASMPRPLSIVLILVDTLRADHLGAYGYARPTSPRMDALARTGTVFLNGWAHAPSTRYSMPALFWGRFPSAVPFETCIGCKSWWPRISNRMRQIGEIAKSQGLMTGGLFTYSYFDRLEARGFERGFDVYDTSRARLHQNVAGPAESVGTSAKEITDDAVAFIERHAADPFFLVVHYYDPHLSYQKHPEAPDFGDTELDIYDNEIWFTDFHIGRLLDALAAQGVDEKTAVFLTGDHGEGLGERGIKAHGYHLYPPQTKVPFIARVPGFESRRVAAPAGHVDLSATLVHLMGSPPEPSFQGRSLVADMLGQEPTDVRPVFQEVSYEGNNKKRAFVTETHQLIWNWTPHNTTECYRLEDGDWNTPDIWDTPSGHPECGVLKRRLRAFVTQLALPEGYLRLVTEHVSPSPDAAPRPAHALQGRIGDILEVIGYDLEGSAQLSPGRGTRVTVHFKVAKPIPEGWRLFFHLDGPAFYNLDHPPVEGAYPIERWRAGQVIRDTFTIPNQALRSGTYRYTVGLWKGQERMPISPASSDDGASRLVVTELQVMPAQPKEP
jgi:arylsulfatase A-like enzyme